MRFFNIFIRYATFLAAIGGIFLMVQVIQIIHASESPTIPPPPVAPPEKPYENSIAGTGILEALSENVSIGVPQSGLVTDVSVKVSDKVKKGDPLMKIDDRELQAQLINQQAAVAVSKATLELKQATLAKTQDMLDRMNAVQDKRAISMDDLHNRTNDVLVAKADRGAAEAQLRSAEAAVASSETLLKRLTILAPRDGTIIQVNVRTGEYASTQPHSAPILLGDLDKLQVRTDIDEQSASRIRPGQPAKAFVKGDTAHAISLSFLRIEPYVIPKVSLTGSSTERVDTRVLQVIYSLQQPADQPLYVGQQMDVFIDSGVVK
ncbi:MAG: putative Membrane-fusion protein [Verrucomicrobiaceae bacterium]|nr:putative Membrane-fusion protein [Verrucomicrobiaceae bacterium]